MNMSRHILGTSHLSASSVKKLFSKAELTRRGTNSKYADSSPADAQSKPEAEVKVEDEATETVDSDEVSKELNERLDEKQDYSPAAVELRNKFCTSEQQLTTTRVLKL